MIEILNYILIAMIALVIVITTITSTIIWSKKRKLKNGEIDNGKTIVSGNTKSSISNNKTDNIEGKDIFEDRKDMIITAHKTIKASENGELKPGKYTILSTTEGKEKFYVRLGKFVKECKHGDIIVLADGDEITPTSIDIILR